MASPEQQHMPPPPGVVEAAVTFAGPEGWPLAGILCQPAAATTSGAAAAAFSPQHCALLCHGFASHKQGFHFPAIARHLAAQLGLSSLRFDYSGNMDSPGPFRFASFHEEVQQMQAAQRFLQEQHGMRVLVLIGHSRGAINATLFCAAQAQAQQAQQQQQQAGNAAPAPAIVPLVVLIAGRLDLTLNMIQRYGQDVLQQLQDTGPWQQVTRRDGDRQEIKWQLSAEDMQARFAYDVAGACAAISAVQPPETRPRVLVLRGGSDAICDPADGARLAGAIAGARFVEVAGADHWFARRCAELLAALQAFLLEAARDARLTH